MASNNWYHNELWNPEIEQEFFKRLSRSRSSRDQSLVIQSVTIPSVEPQVA